jgi:hypothetical protein
LVDTSSGQRSGGGGRLGLRPGLRGESRGSATVGAEHKRDGVIGREVANIALIMFAEKSCASATKIL